MTPHPQPAAPALKRSDLELVVALAQGDDGALAELYDRYVGLALGVAYRILGNREDAEEVAQEAFVHCWRSAASYEPERASVVTWLLLVVRSRAIDRLRNRRVVERTHQELEPESHTSSEGFSSVLSDERRIRVRQELDSLPSEQRQVVEMAFFGGLTQTQIAAATGIPLGTVKTRTLLAMKKLRGALRQEIQELL